MRRTNIDKLISILEDDAGIRDSLELVLLKKALVWKVILRSRIDFERPTVSCGFILDVMLPDGNGRSLPVTKRRSANQQRACDDDECSCRSSPYDQGLHCRRICG